MTLSHPSERGTHPPEDPLSNLHFLQPGRCTDWARGAPRELDVEQGWVLYTY